MFQSQTSHLFKSHVLFLTFRRSDGMPARWTVGAVLLTWCISTSSAQNSSIPSNFSVAAVTPDATFVQHIFSTEADRELPDQSILAGAASYQWERQFNSSKTAPYLVCADFGRSGIAPILEHFTKSSTLAFYSSSNITCYIIQSYASEIQNITMTNSLVKYATPLPPVLKLAKGFFRQVNTGYYLADIPTCDTGVRIVFAPGIGQYKKNLNGLLTAFRSDLLYGGFKDIVSKEFIWASDYSNVMGSLETRRKKLRTRDSLISGNATTVSPHIRAKKWIDRLSPVLNGSYVCDFSTLRFMVEPPYIRVSETCSLLQGDADQGASCMLAFLAYIILDSSVLYVEPFPQLTTMNNVASGIIQSGNPNKYPIWNRGIKGEGQVVQVADTGLDMSSCFFNDPSGNVPTTTFSTAYYDSSKRKVIQYVVWSDSSDQAGGHGTHVSGTVAGNCNNNSSPSIKYNGMAPNAKIAFYDAGDSTGRISIPSNLVLKTFPPGYTAGARIFSNSWGTTSNAVTYLDIQFDQFMYDYPETMILAAAGNTGSKGLNTVISPALCKNGLSVGASENVQNSNFNMTVVARFSARGPSADGRFKPDILAPGHSLLSSMAGSKCSTLSMLGTSMATPVVAGALALIRQYYTEGWYPTGTKTTSNAIKPSGALLKATIINSAQPMIWYKDGTGAVFRLGDPPGMYTCGQAAIIFNFHF